MASSTLDHDDVTLVCKNPNSTVSGADLQETLISTRDIHSWDLSEILRFQTLQIRAHRGTLVQQSSFFRGLIAGSFSESRLERVPIQWHLETFINVLKCMYGCPIVVTPRNFLFLFEAALYFGSERLLSECKRWLYEVFSSKRPRLPEMQLDDIIQIWNFGVEHASDFVPELCASYLARNFMWATYSGTFGCIPYPLLLCCVKHPHLTVHSEMYLSEALLVWIKSSRAQSVCEEDEFADVLKQIRVYLLPLWFSAGRRRCQHFEEFSSESIGKVRRLMKISPSGLNEALGDIDLDQIKIRLTEYSKVEFPLFNSSLMVVDLSGCPQLTSGMLFLSLLPSSCGMDLASDKFMKQSLMKLDSYSRSRGEISQVLQPALCFEAVEELDISRCERLNIETTIECLAKSFPSLRKIKAAHLLNFTPSTLYKLLHKCPLIDEVDLTADITPLIPSQVSVLSSSVALSPMASKYIIGGNNYLDRLSYCLPPSISNITRITLEGRSDIYDSDLQCLSEVCVSLHYINLKGCISVSDGGIASLIHACLKLHSILVCDTSFGRNSILALCFMVTNSGTSPVVPSRKRNLDALACRLQTLHIGGCMDVGKRLLVELISQTPNLKSLCLRGTNLVDDALYNFPGSSLEFLDVANTRVSGSALSHIVRCNPSLKCLNGRGCRNLISQEHMASVLDLLSQYASEEQYGELGHRHIWEELALGWGFSCLSLDHLKPAIMSLRKITIGLGGSLSEDSLRQLPMTCTLLESINLYFQVISDSLVLNVLTSLRHLRVLSICYCFGDISMSSFRTAMPNLRKLRLERVTPWMTNHDLNILVENCTNLVELSLLGCKLLNSESLHIIAQGWPGLISIHLEDCGESTDKGASSLFNCMALEDIVLRHSGCGIPRTFIIDASMKMPMLRKVSLDMCDACEGDYDIPTYADRYFLSVVKIAKCKYQRCDSSFKFIETRRSPVHKETLVLVWNSEKLVRTVVKERL